MGGTSTHLIRLIMVAVLTVLLGDVAFAAAGLFKRSFHCTQRGFCREYNAADTSNPGIEGYSYAYAPSIIREQNGRMHMWYCSMGLGNGGDAIRHVSSTDGGKTWGRPRVVVQAQYFHNTWDRDACDPSVVRYGDYYYMFYGSAEHAFRDPRRPPFTVIQVARARSMDEAFLTLTERGTWEYAPYDPKVVIQPVNRGRTDGRYGAGQPSATIVDGQIYLFYYDDSEENQLTGKIYLKISTDPANWAMPFHRVQSVFGSPDIKFDPIRRAFVSVWADNHVRCAQIRGSVSGDGINWTAPKTLYSASQIPRYAHNLGFEGNEWGQANSAGNPLIVVSGHEDVAGTESCADTPGTVAVEAYRFSHGPYAQHVMVPVAEGAAIGRAGWERRTAAGGFFTSAQAAADLVPVYRYFHPSGDHLFTSPSAFPGEFQINLPQFGFQGGFSGLYLYRSAKPGSVPIVRLSHKTTGIRRYVSSHSYAQMFSGQYNINGVIGYAAAPLVDPNWGYWQPYGARTSLLKLY